MLSISFPLVLLLFYFLWFRLSFKCQDFFESFFLLVLKLGRGQGHHVVQELHPSRHCVAAQPLKLPGIVGILPGQPAFDTT